MRNRKRTIIIAWTLVLLWMLLIFALSAEKTLQTNELSMGVTQMITGTRASIETQISDPDNIAVRANAVIRKVAHFSLFLVLGMLICYALGISGIKGPKGYTIALLLCALYAASDEIHQIFVPGRNAAFTDVLIDTAGSLVGLLLYMGFRRINRKSVRKAPSVPKEMP